MVGTGKTQSHGHTAWLLCLKHVAGERNEGGQVSAARATRLKDGSGLEAQTLLRNKEMPLTFAVFMKYHMGAGIVCQTGRRNSRYVQPTLIHGGKIILFGPIVLR